MREFEELVRWWSQLRQKGLVRVAVELGAPSTAKTVSWRDRQPIVTDGPYMEAKEAVGGVGILEVETQEHAIEIAKSWPRGPGIRIEIRPLAAS